MIETDTAFLHVEDNIYYVRIKENAEIDKEAVEEIINKRTELMADKPYAVLLDSTKYYFQSPDARDALAKADLPSRVAFAVVTKNLSMKLVVNVFRRFYKVDYPLKIFSNEKDAVVWLKNCLSKS